MLTNVPDSAAPFLQGEWLLDKQTHQRLQLLDPKGILQVAVGSMKSRQAEAVHGIKYKYDQEYQGSKAYIQGNYEEAATLANRLVKIFQTILAAACTGHIYCILQEYDLAREQYQVVLNLTKEPELIDY